MKKIIYLSLFAFFSMYSSQLMAQDPGDSTLIDVYGCMDAAALNYNPLATIDDGSCVYWQDTTGTDIVLGCMDPEAQNYNPLATIDDGSCYYGDDSTLIDIYGCMDPAALNYNFLATIDDGSCIYDNDTSGTGFIYGCMDPVAINYNPLATIDDGSCFYDNDTTGTGFIYGCMDPIATNYNPLATIDDGSCVYENDTLLCNAYFIIDEINEDEGYVTVINLSTGVDLNYYWDFGDSTFSTEAYPTHIYENEGFYMVCLTVVGNTPAGGNCASTYCDTVGIYFFQKTNGFTLNIIQNEATGINEPLDEISEINLYPNPANQRLTLSLTSIENEMITMSIYDLSGRVVKTWNSTITYGNNKMNIDINDLSPGLYHLELRNNDERKVKRFQIIK